MGTTIIGIKDIIMAGGFTLGILALLSIFALATIWERWNFYRTYFNRFPAFINRLRRLIDDGEVDSAVKVCKQFPGPASKVVMACLVGPTGKEDRARQAERALEKQVSALERRLPALGTIGSTSPFIGLFGTVLGVMRAFRDLAGAANAGPGVVAVGISEALVATAAGLFVAIPAIIAYNYFTTRANGFADELRWITSELLDRLTEKSSR